MVPKINEIISLTSKLQEIILTKPGLSADTLDQFKNRLTTMIQIAESQVSGSYRIWSDGACSGNPGPGGWGTIIQSSEGTVAEFSGGKKNTTNNVMELKGALEGILLTPVGSNIILTSDSQYLIKGMTEWLKNWKKKNWKKADGKPVLNKELWQQLDKAASERSIKWEWIKGHNNHPQNERCDLLAREAIESILIN